MNHFSADKVKNEDKAIVDAFKAVRPTAAQLKKNDIGAILRPQVKATNGTMLKNLKGTTFFVRDYLQVQGAGGSESTSWEINGLTIHDGIQDSKFKEKFNKLVGKVNDGMPSSKQQLQGFGKVAHRDAIQLIPIEKKAGNKVIRQMMGATMRHIKVNGNTITSKGELQGIFATDGIFQDLSITNNTIDTQGSHTISFNGMLSGTIKGNKNTNGILPKDKIKLYPVRIGGGANIYVMGFQNKRDDKNQYAYEPIKGGQEITDLRYTHPPQLGATYWKNIHMPTLKSTPKTLHDKSIRQLNQVKKQLNAEYIAARKLHKSASELNAIKAKYQPLLNNAIGEMMKRAGGIPDQ